ncbi:MAG: hypothetical protein K0S47_3478 [Herbinix sp.]|jgi:AcrR family transcriptional regulator|nr:hypothetical protein [Herbinix sp.]
MNPEKKYIIRKQELFSQITDLIRKDGYANLTVRGICNDLGISTGTFYHYFPEKNDLAWILFSDIDDYFKDVVAFKFDDNELNNLITYCIEYGNYVVDSGVETCRCISVAPLKHMNHNYLDENRSLFQLLLKILVRGVEKKQFNDTFIPLEITRMLMVLLRGYSSDWAKCNGNYDLVEKLENFIRLFSKSIVN